MPAADPRGSDEHPEKELADLPVGGGGDRHDFCVLSDHRQRQYGDEDVCRICRFRRVCDRPML